MSDQNNPTEPEVHPRDYVEERMLLLYGPAEVLKYRARQAQKNFAKLPRIVQQESWLQELGELRKNLEAKGRVWPRIIAQDADYRTFDLARAFVELLEVERVGHCAAYRADYWWHKEYKLWLRDPRGNLMHRLFVQTFGDDIQGWLSDGDEDDPRRFSLSTGRAGHRARTARPDHRVEPGRRGPGTAARAA